MAKRRISKHEVTTFPPMSSDAFPNPFYVLARAELVQNIQNRPGKSSPPQPGIAAAQ